MQCVILYIPLKFGEQRIDLLHDRRQIYPYAHLNAPWDHIYREYVYLDGAFLLHPM